MLAARALRAKPHVYQCLDEQMPEDSILVEWKIEMKIKRTSVYVDDPAGPARGNVLYGRRAGRLRAHEGTRRRVHHVTDGRDRFQDRYAERYVRQSNSGHAADARVALGSTRRQGGGSPSAGRDWSRAN